MSFNRQLVKEDAVHIYGGILLGHKKSEIVPFATALMSLEGIMQNEAEKDTHHMILLICGI